MNTDQTVRPVAAAGCGRVACKPLAIVATLREAHSSTRRRAPVAG
jgi:hypothetical protein